MKQRFLLCVDNEGYEASLEARKLYETIPDNVALGPGMQSCNLLTLESIQEIAEHCRRERGICREDKGGPWVKAIAREVTVGGWNL